MSSLPDINPKLTATPADATETGSSAQQFFRTYWQIARGFSRRLEPLLVENYGLELKEYAILNAIKRNVRYPTGLAAHLGLSKDSTSRALRKLLRNDWLERKIDKQDSRRTRLSLTPAGVELLVAMDADLNATIGTLLQDMEGNRASQLLQDMEALVQLLNSDINDEGSESESDRPARPGRAAAGNPHDDTDTESDLD